MIGGLLLIVDPQLAVPTKLAQRSVSAMSINMRRSVLPFASVHTNTSLSAGDTPSALSSRQHLQRRLQSFEPWCGASNL